MNSSMMDTFRLIVLSVTLVVSGCGKAKVPGRPELVQVSGTVTFKQQPVSGAMVIFAPQNHSNAAVSMTDDQGNFRMQSYDPRDGAALGAYQVIIKKVEMDGEKERHLLPEKYSVASKSGLVAEVKASEKNVFNFDLKQ